MDMAGGHTWHAVFRPVPLFERRRVELQLARGRREAFAGFAVDHHADGYAVSTNDAVLLIHLRRLKLGGLQFALMQTEDGRLLLWYLKRSVLLHVLQGSQLLAFRRLGQTGYTILEDPAIILEDAQLFARTIR